MKKLILLVATALFFTVAAFAQTRQIVLETQSARAAKPKLVVQEWL